MSCNSAIVNATKDISSTNQGFTLQDEIETRHAKKSSEERESESESTKANKMPKTTQREAIAYVGSQKATVHLEIHGQSSITQKREAKGRDDLVRTFFSVSCT